ncbi:MAG: fluoride efflux transporter CrcB [Acidobacteriaceae bacterium]
MAPYLWITLGSALGGVLRYVLTRLMLHSSSTFPWGTILINIIGCFVIGFFGTFTFPGSRFEVSENVRMFVMVGLCGGFTTFSSFSLETLDLIRTGGWTRAVANVLLSVILGLGAVALGHLVAHHSNGVFAIAATQEEEFTG